MQPEHPTSLKIRTLGASATGSDHRRDGSECQDAWRMAWIPDGCILAVADGLGSASHSAEGSAIACQAACAALADSADTDILQAMHAARKALQEHAQADGMALRELATTLLVARIRHGKVECAHLGDGAIVGQEGNWLVLLSRPEESECCDVVVPLTSDDWFDHVRISPERTGLDAVALFTDGLERAGLRRDCRDLIPHGPFFEPLFRHLHAGGSSQDVAAMLAGPRLDQHTGDDRTIAMASVPPREGDIR